MKRGTPEHPKTYTFAALLNIPRWGAGGLLEFLWHFTAKYAPDGNVGKYPDEAIARHLAWEGNAATLVSALVQAGWLDRCVCHRLRVHDWPEHADQTAKRAANHTFLSCYGDASKMLANAENNLASLPCLATALPQPGPQPHEPQSGRSDASGAPRKNPLVEGRRDALQDECLALVRRKAELTGMDPVEVMAKASGYEGAKRTKLNPASMTDDRLAATVLDLRADVSSLERKQGEKRGA